MSLGKYGELDEKQLIRVNIPLLVVNMNLEIDHFNNT